MLDRLMAAMCRIPDVGKEVEVLGTALEKGLLDLGWEDLVCYFALVDFHDACRVNQAKSFEL
jgi:hypothetical protein